jgi:hypothetical protein
MAEQDKNLVDQAFDEVKKQFGAALEFIGGQSQEQIEAMVAVPVEYAGSMIIRSQPYEPPRLEEGVYHASMHHTVILGDDNATLILYTDDPKAPYLEFGTEIMAPRPSFAVILNYWESTLLGRVVEFFQGNQSQQQGS